MTKLTSRFTDAFAFAFDVHRGQTQKGTTVPYIAHLLEVAGLVLSYGGNEDEAIAALLHDTVEDHPEVVSFETINKRFGARVAAIVEGCSDTSVSPKPPWRPRKEKYIAHLHGADESVLMVAAADKLANARAVLKDYRKVGDKVWERFNAGKSDQLWFYGTVTQTLAEAAGNGRVRALVQELERAVTELERLCGTVSTPLKSALGPLTGCKILPVPTPKVVVGVDVGEDFLDLAVLQVASLAIEHRRIALAGIEDDPLRILRGRLAQCCPDCGPGWLVLIDSPRWPRDLDCSSRTVLTRDPVPPGRILDQALRAMLRASHRHRAMQLSMFPTPKFAYFKRCAKAPTCKAHLRAIYRQLFENGTSRPASDSISAPARLAGGTFTRFMLAGFVTFRAWQDLGAQILEAYPDLQYRLSSHEVLPPKRARKAAVAERIAIARRLRHSLGIDMTSTPATLDQADAEILALTATIAAKQGSLAALEHPAEGRFLITFERAQAFSNLAD